jgi:hypothetical protein
MYRNSKGKFLGTAKENSFDTMDENQNWHPSVQYELKEESKVDKSAEQSINSVPVKAKTTINILIS